MERPASRSRSKATNKPGERASAAGRAAAARASSAAETQRSAKSQKLNFDDVSSYRKRRGENQAEFWHRFGVTQSGGSRYESGRALPKAVKMLLWMYSEGIISDEHLKAAADTRRRRAH